MQIIDTTLGEVKDFIENLTEDETRYYKMNYEDLIPQLIYLKGCRVNGILVGISGLSKKYSITYNFRMIKKDHWGKGLGTQMSHDIFPIIKTLKFPYILRIINTDNIAVFKSIVNIKPNLGFKVGKIYYIVQSFNSRGRFFSPFILLLVYFYQIFNKTIRRFRAYS